MLGAVEGGTWDLLVVGGGIFGAGVAREAALHGWRTLLCDRDDFGSATSQSSSKLIHGGLRYLQHGRFKLVREALRERHVLERLAPGLVEPVPFMVPVRPGDRPGKLALRIGLGLYDLFARGHTSLRRRFVGPEEARDLVPCLCDGDLRAAGIYWDYRTDDASLVYAVVRSAIDAGAEACNHVAVRAIRRDGAHHVAELEDVLTGERASVTARAVANAAGPWTDVVRAMAGEASRPSCTFSKGIHVVVPQRDPEHALLLRTGVDGRIVFVIPWHGRTLIGTTDTPFAGTPEDAGVSEDEIVYLLDTVNRHLVNAIPRDDVIASFCGLRTLGDAGPGLARASREERIWEEPEGVVNVINGKLTTFRLIARRMLELLAPRVGRDLDDGALSRETPFASPPLIGRDPVTWHPSDAELDEAVASWHVRTARDLMRRRLPVLLVRTLDETERSDVVERLGRRLDWLPGRRAAELEALGHA